MQPVMTPSRILFSVLRPESQPSSAPSSIVMGVPMTNHMMSPEMPTESTGTSSTALIDSMLLGTLM